jgi:hypothetical protein
VSANTANREIAFNLGRPDTLGMDEYHNRQPQAIKESEHAIIPCMILFSKITRQVSTEIYFSRLPWKEKLQNADHIQRELNLWVETLPLAIKPDTTIEGRLSQLALREPKWCRRQRLTIRLRE